MNGVDTQLERLEQELKCVICLSIFDDPYSLPCNHNFCHDCIMESFRVKSQCPLCKLPTFKRAIVKNQSIANVIVAYQSLRSAMTNSLENGPSHTSHPAPTPNTPDETSRLGKKRGNHSNDVAPSPSKRQRKNQDEAISTPPPAPQSPRRSHRNQAVCMDFSVVLDSPSKFVPSSTRRNLRSTDTSASPLPVPSAPQTPTTPQSPPRRRTRRTDVETQTTPSLATRSTNTTRNTSTTTTTSAPSVIPFDPYFKTNPPPAPEETPKKGKKRGGRKAKTEDDSDDTSENDTSTAKFNMEFNPNFDSTSSRASSSSSSNRNTSESPSKFDFDKVTSWNSLKKTTSPKTMSPKSPSASSTASPLSLPPNKRSVTPSPLTHPATLSGNPPRSQSPTRPATTKPPQSGAPNGVNQNGKPATQKHPLPTPAQVPTPTTTHTTRSTSHPQPTQAPNHTPNHTPTKTETSRTPASHPPPTPTSPVQGEETPAKSKANATPVKTPFKKSKCEKVVILPTSLDPKVVTSVKATLKELGGSLVSKYSSEVSHIVAGCTGNHCARRTIKYCLGVVEGKWVVSAEWLAQSLASQFWVSEQPFEVQGDSVTKGGPKVARESLERGAQPLFSNCTVYLYGDFQSPTKAEISKLLKLGGAQVSLKLPTKKKTPPKGKTKGAKKEEEPTEVIVCESTGFSTLAPEEVAKIKGLGWTVADMKWVLDCVSFYRILPFLEYELG